MNRVHIVSAALLLAAGLIACGDNESGITRTDGITPKGKLTNATECKKFETNQFLIAGSTSESCVEYGYDEGNGILRLRHINAGFNCCPGELLADITVENGVITVSEKESEAACNCNCLYDLDFEIENIAVGTYRIVFLEPYRAQGDEELDFFANLGAAPSGTNCVPRHSYPWGL